ncbi:hypothetical protein L1987_03967 [Smallanthus sonchifolius]|uniref:Uncharacterized protein n=1 Tax=Smallanthus sonchifolius TaxID=185202 RepID=A0ACB9KCA0_9ASTR|nr:hypothetical protein L1987_03967 [Smallanthus sonchifolius]
MGYWKSTLVPKFKKLFEKNNLFSELINEEIPNRHDFAIGINKEKLEPVKANHIHAEVSTDSQEKTCGEGYPGVNCGRTCAEILKSKGHRVFRKARGDARYSPMLSDLRVDEFCKGTGSGSAVGGPIGREEASLGGHQPSPYHGQRISTPLKQNQPESRINGAQVQPIELVDLETNSNQGEFMNPESDSCLSSTPTSICWG